MPFIVVIQNVYKIAAWKNKKHKAVSYQIPPYAFINQDYLISSL